MTSTVDAPSRGDQPTTLYRLYDADGKLLYVGIADNWPSRLKQHKRNQPWWGEVSNVATQQFATRQAAQSAERAAIRAERPKYNVVHNRAIETKVRTVHVEAELRWRCDVCLTEIKDSDGHITLLDVDRLAYRKAMAAWQAKYPDQNEPRGWGRISVSALFDRPKPLKWRCVHKDCDPYPEDGGYWFNVDRIRDVRDLLDWCQHIGGKAWPEEHDFIGSLIEHRITK